MAGSPRPERLRVILGQNPGPLTGAGTNTYLLGGARLVLIDTGAGLPAYEPLLREAVTELGGRLALVLVTHSHRDHIGGLAAVRRLYPEAVVRALQTAGRLPGGVPVAAGERIQTDGVTLRAIHTPGHAADHLCFYWEEERALFSGDHILGEGSVVVTRAGGGLRHYLDSLERLRTLDMRRIYPGHGPAILEPQARIEEVLAHRRMREGQVLDALRAGDHCVREIVARVYAGAQPALRPLAEETVGSHLELLEAAGRVRRMSRAGQECYELTG